MSTKQPVSRIGIISILILLLLVLPSGSALGRPATAAVGTAFTYQGQLTRSGSLYTGSCDFQFGLWDALSGPTQISSTLIKTAVTVTNGLFTVQLDFGTSAFTGSARWLEIGVQCTGDPGFTTLAPRQPLTPAPYALYATAAGNATTVTNGVYTTGSYANPSWITSLAGSKISGAVASATSAISFSGSLSGDVTGTQSTTSVFKLRGVIIASTAPTSGQLLQYSGTQWAPTTPSFWSLTGNAGTNPSTNYLGTSDNQAFEIRVNGLRALRLEPNVTSANIIGGYSGNTASTGVFSATIAGGGASGFPNQVTDNGGTVSGGVANQAGDNAGTTSDAETATIGGGYENTASGPYSTVSGGFTNIASGSQAVVGGGGENRAQGNLSTIGGGAYNVTDADFATISGGGPSDLANSSTTNNSVFDDYGTVGGGADNHAGSNDGDKSNAYYATVGGGILNQASNQTATVSGGRSNTASGDSATVAGGYFNTSSASFALVGGGNGNQATFHAATVGGGQANLASNEAATVAGGYVNSASAAYATVAGGNTNTASAVYATVGGGNTNQATNQAATVSGGWVNTAMGNAATVPGGASNVASGAYSFAAGAQAIAQADGTFVWADTTSVSFDPISYPDPGGVLNSFNIRATGGVYLVTDVNASTGRPTAGMWISGGGSGWNVYSDRSFKTNLQGVNDLNLLERLAAIPISSWNYKTQSASIRHIGPMAQDFNAAFGVGEADKSGEKRYINSIDADGVALAAIQGLYRLNQQQAAEIQSLKIQLSQGQSSGSPHSTGSLPLVWVVVGLLVLAQVGMFLFLRRRLGGRS
jgi:trimeric autotransporter adhesin